MGLALKHTPVKRERATKTPKVERKNGAKLSRVPTPEDEARIIGRKLNAMVAKVEKGETSSLIIKAEEMLSSDQVLDLLNRNFG